MNGNGKQPFKKRLRLKLSELNAEFPDHMWTFWASPTPDTLEKLNAPARYYQDIQDGQPIDGADYEARVSLYMDAISECVLDTGESGIDLSTPETVRATMQAPGVDVELIGSIVLEYTLFLVRRLEEREKKAGALFHSTAGNFNSDAKADTSQT